MSKIVIDNVNVNVKRTREEKYPFSKLEIGKGSFHIKESDNKNPWSTVNNAGERLGKKFKCSKVGFEDDRGPGFRVWRVE